MANPFTFLRSQSAKRIVARAGDVDIQVQIQELRKYIESLPSDPVPAGLKEILELPVETQKIHLEQLPMDHPHRKYFGSALNAAKRAIAGRIPHQFHVDPVSGVSVGQFIAACWIAAKDPAARHEKVSLETAKEKFVQTLYEIQREYNLDGEVKVTDNLLPDVPSCGSGAFNKINNTQSETLVDCETIVTRSDTINVRTLAFVKEKIADMVRNEPAVSAFTEPDEDGNIYCTEEFANSKIGEFFKELEHEFIIPGEPDKESDRKTKQVQDYLYTYLTEYDMSDVIHAAKDKGKARAD